MMRNSTFVTTLVVLIAAVLATGFIARRPMPVVVATNLEKLPMEIDGYRATEDHFPEFVYKELNADKHVYRHYRAAAGNVIDLYMGYYGTAKGGRTGHNPYACLPGGGSAIIDTGTVYVHQGIGGHSVPLNYIHSRKEGVNTIMLHWYQTRRDSVVTTGLMQNVKRLSGRVLYNSNDGAFVRLTTSGTDGDLPRAKKQVEGFAQTVLNLLPHYWPVEK